MDRAPDLLTITPAPGGLALAGEIDAHTAPSLETAIGQLDGDVALDLAEVEFVDSSGLRIIIEAHHALVARDAVLTIRNPSPAVQRLLEISGVDGYLNVV
jgi:anti-sigma B factor antagonist